MPDRLAQPLELGSTRSARCLRARFYVCLTMLETASSPDWRRASSTRCSKVVLVVGTSRAALKTEIWRHVAEIWIWVTTAPSIARVAAKKPPRFARQLSLRDPDKRSGWRVSWGCVLQFGVKDTMLGKCANPACLASFRKLGSGKLFAFESLMNVKSVEITPNSGSAKTGRTPMFFWLCETCSLTITLGLDGVGQLTM